MQSEERIINASVSLLDAIINRYNNSHQIIINNNVMKIYYGYKQCYTENDPDLINNYPGDMFYSSISSENTHRDEIISFIKKCMNSGHMSPLEHASVTFVIDCSRTASHQIVRSRIGVAISQKSQRYVKEKKENIVIPPSIYELCKKDDVAKEDYTACLDATIDLYDKLISLNIPKGDARFVLTQGIKTTIQMTFNFRALYHFFELRLCKRAQWEIRTVAEMMLKLMRTYYPGLFDDAGPVCSKLGYCTEHDSCGLKPKREDVIVMTKQQLANTLEKYSTMYNEVAEGVVANALLQNSDTDN